MTRRNGVSSTTPDNVLIGPGLLYANFTSMSDPGTLLGATKGGNQFNLNREITNLEVDGARGKVKGMDRVSNVSPQIVANLIEVTKANIIKAIAGANDATTPVNVPITREIVGVGDDAQTSFQLEYGSAGAEEGTIQAGTYYLYVNDPEDTDAGDVLLAETTDYSLVTATGTITMVVALPSEHVLIATYVGVTSDSATHDSVTGGDIASGDYLTNVALVGEIQGSTNPIICIVKNVLAEGGVSFDMQEEDDSVMVATFEGRFDSSDLTTEPWEIQYPVS